MKRGLESSSGLIVGGQRLPIKQASAEGRSFQGASCECGCPLEFNTNLFGYVLETCSECHYTRPMRPVRPRTELETQVVMTEGQNCITKGCKNWVPWSGTGPRRRKCNPCTLERQRFLSREWQRKHKKPRAA